MLDQPRIPDDENGSTGPGQDRRAVLLSLGGLLGALATPVSLGSLLAATACAPGASDAIEYRNLVRAVGGLVIPDGASPGAGSEAVADFVVRAVTHGLRGVRDSLLGDVAAELDRRAVGTFLSAPPATRAKVVAELDTVSHADLRADRSGWPLLKMLILMGYYTSEAGASRELVYELIPGRFDADIRLQEQPVALSNDWIGVAIRYGAPA